MSRCVGISARGSWAVHQNKCLFVLNINEKAAATAELELIFDGRDYSRDLGANKDGSVFLKNDNIEVDVVSKPDRKRGILRQTIRARAKKEGVLKGRYVVTLRARKEGKILVAMHWSYLGDVDKLARIDTYYPHYTWMEGYKNQLRTPAVCAWNGDCSVTVASLGPHPTHVVIEKGQEGLRFIVCLDRPGIGPDGYEENPRLLAGEELTAHLYMDTAQGDWQTGMTRWMRYNMSNVVKDDDIPPAWTKDVRMFWCKWDKINRRDIDEMAGLGVEMLEVHPFTEPDPSIIAYAHKKGLRILLEHYLLSYYEPVRLTHLHLSPGVDDLHIRKASLAMAAEHPDWCALDQNGNRMGIDKQSGTYVHMDPNVEAFRQAKVKEAVDAVKKGYDGVRYDNALVLNCFSKDHRHTMTYAHAVFTMLKEIRQAIREVNPEAAVAINNAGPDLYSVADMHMYESGLSSESLYCEQAGKEKLKGSSYIGAHNRLMTAKVLWEFAGKRYCIHDYPVQTQKGEPAIWRSCIFTVMHDGICSFGGAMEKMEGSRLPEYRIASALLDNIKGPLTDIINDKNIAYRLYSPGTILVLETKGKKWHGTIKGLNLPIETEQEYNLYSLSNARVYRVGKGEDFLSGIRLEVAADGYEVLQVVSGGGK